MSKQLLHSYQSHVVIAALNDRAFAVLKDSESSSSTATVVELMVAANANNDGGASKNDNDGGDKDKEDAKAKDGESKSTEKKGEEKQEKKKNKKGKNINNQDSADPHEIQAVCSTEIDSRVWLAVSRENKTLSLYSVPSAKESEQQSTKTIYPDVTYNLPKRARCLAFSGVPSSSSSGKTCHVIIAGDLGGDAFAFPIPTDAGGAKAKSVTRRLLLGHTASILTGLNMVPTTWDKKDNSQSQKQQLILSADRDEKVRVSYFPETHIVHGYLMGHSSFISTMDAAAGSERKLCITGGGDGTVRLWDYQTCKEVGMVPVVIKKCPEDEEDEKMNGKEESEGNEDEVMDEDLEKGGQQEEGADDDADFDEDYSDDEESIDSRSIAVPVALALGPNAESVIVARDSIASIDVHPIPAPPSKSSASSMSLLLSHLVSLHKKETLECPSQPLAVRSLSDGSVLVLVKEPDYIIHFQRDDSQGKFKNSSSSSSSFSMALRDAVKDQTITMPISALEKEKNGELKMQKNMPNGRGKAKEGESVEDQVKRSGLHWNDAGRKDMAKLAEQRRRKRRKDEAIEKKKSIASAVETENK